MGRSALLTLTLSASAVLAYLGYRAVTVPTSEPQATVTELVESLPEFFLADMEGTQRSIRSWPDRAMIINFWATWCAPCLREIPLLKVLQEQQAGNGVQVVGIAIDRIQPVIDFADDMQFNYPVLVGESDAMDAAAAFGVQFFALPFTVFTDREHRLLGVHTGEIHEGDLQNLVAVLADLAEGRIDLATARSRVAGRM